MEPLLLLHGAIGSAGQLRPLIEKLNNNYKIYTLDFSGHGGKPVSGEPFSIGLFADNVLVFMEKHGLSKVSVFGYSMGGYVGLYLAKNHPEKINRIVTLATKFYWDKLIAVKEVQMLNPEKIEQKIPAFAETLKQRHTPPMWKDVLKKTAEMMIALGGNNTLKQGDYATIGTPVLILLGDQDKMVTIDETIAVYKELPNAQLGILPGTQHPIEQVDIDLLAFMLTHFLL